MRKIIPLLAAMCIMEVAIAQQPSIITTINPYPKTITVNGSAEMEIVPDEIFVNIQLFEYQKKGETKKDLETIKTQFLEACKSVGVPDSLISIVFYAGYNNSSYYYIRRKKDPNMQANITYQIKFKNSKLMDDLVDKLDDNATRSFQIVSTNHTRIAEFRKQLKIKAVQAAKEKGVYLTEAMGEKLGETVTITEPAEIQPIPYIGYSNAALRGNAYAKSFESYGNADQIERPEMDFKKIKLRYEVNVVFALK